MFDDSIKLLEMPEHNSISVCVHNENEGIFEFGEEISEQYEDAYMNGYNWDALITYYVNKMDPDLMSVINTDPEAGMFSAYVDYSPENLVLMKKFEAYIKTMLSDTDQLLKFIADNYDNIEWD